MRVVGLRTLVVGVCGVAFGCGNAAEDGRERISTSVQAVTQTVTLPVPVGLNPQDLTLGATGTVTVNDRAQILGPLGSGTGGNLAAKGTAQSSTGVGSGVRNLWATGNLWFRQSAIGYYKTQGTVSIQDGTTFADPDENRANVTINWDPIWKVELTVPPGGSIPNLSAPVVPGNYGAVTVYSGQTLNLSSGDYTFTSLDLEPGSAVMMANPAPRIFVNSNLILRSGLVGTGLILAYLGSNPASVEASFHGDLFLAPNADLSIKADSIGHFFAKNITVFEAVRVWASPFTPAAVQMVVPSSSASNLGPMMPNGGGASEIAGAIVAESATDACGSTPTAFLSFHAGNMYKAAINGTPAFYSASELDLPTPSTPPTSCIGSPVPFTDSKNQAIASWFAYTHRTTATMPYYSPGGGTDNLTARLSGGRVIEVGFGVRNCFDQPTTQAASCPSSPPVDKTSCSCVPVSIRTPWKRLA